MGSRVRMPAPTDREAHHGAGPAHLFYILSQPIGTSYTLSMTPITITPTSVESRGLFAIPTDS